MHRLSILVGLTALVVLGAGSATVRGVEEDAERSPVSVLIEEGRYPEAEEEARKALERIEAEHGPDAIETADARVELGRALRRLSRIEDALLQFQRALEIRRDAYGEQHADVAESLHLVGGTLEDAGRYDESRASLEAALRIRVAIHGAQEIRVADTRQSLAITMMELGRFDEAREQLVAAIAIQDQVYGENHPEVAWTRHALATLLKDVGQYAEAKSLWLEALAVLERAHGPEHPDLSKVLNMLGIVNRRTGDYAEAKQHFERALGISEKAHGEEHIVVAQVLVNYGNLMVKAGEPRKAIELHKRALVIAEKVLGPDNPQVAHPLNNLAQSYLEIGDYARARPLLERALGLWESALGPDHNFVASVVDNLAAMHMLTASNERAGELYARALATRRKVLGDEHPSTAESYDHLARFQWLGLGDAASAVDSALTAEAVAREQFRLIAGGLTEEEALQFEAIRENGFGAALTALSAGGDELPGDLRARAWQQLVRSRALVLDEMASRHRATVTNPSAELAPLVGAFSAARKTLAELVVAGPGGGAPEAYRADVDEALAARERAERALADRSLDYRRARERERATGSDVLGALPEETALVSYVYYDSIRFDPSVATGELKPGTEPIVVEPSYLAFVVLPGGKAPTLVPLGDAAKIDGRIENWRSAVGSRPPTIRAAARRAEAAYRDSGQALRRAVWDPIAAVLGDTERVIVVPDAALHLVSLPTLPDEEGVYLVENGPLLHHVSTERDVVRAGFADGAPEGRGMLALGGPDFDRAEAGLPPRAGPGATLQAASSTTSGYRSPRAGCAELATLTFDPLRAAGSEAREVAQLWQDQRASGEPAQVLTGAWASEAAFKRLAPGRRLLHVATHGFFAQDRCASSLDRTGPAVDGGVPVDNPLLLSGLALAGANARRERDGNAEDGILTAEEIASLDLSAVDWVVLSACETGVGEVRAGEGVLGMRRAFETAGVATLIMSLWQVDDEATREWMEHLYRERLAGLSTAAALRSASLRMIRARREAGRSTHPFTWGAFVAAGGWD